MSSRAPDSADCFNSLKLENDQIPSEAKLYKEGCANALKRVLDENVIYLLAAGTTLMLMGKTV